ncbi:low-density lipoprotein receptor-related protein 2-like isoform X2 [Ptychodera flava]|uniref:low-density lipoprotein receptor-related protein 2-like isoform X2 n=1 Tax=Ptychodera flava TaxID=63121 RepID=UPI00396A73A2
MQNDRIFWLDGGTLLIESIEFDGQGRETFYDYSSLASSPFSHFTGLAIFQDLLYITEAGNLLRVFDKKGKDIIRRLIFPSEINTMKFFHESLQPLAQGPCDVSNGGCDEICINTKYGAECVCSTLYCTPVFRCPHTIANGKLAAGCDNRNGQSCDFTCNIGYFRTTDQPVICTGVGEWNVSSNDLCRLLLNCVSEPCQNDGNCTDTDDGFICTCPSQWHGNVCDIPISSIEKRKGGDIAAVLVSVFVIIFVITAIVLLVLFRRKIFRSCRKTDTTFDGIVSGNKADENAYSGAPTAPRASAPIAPMDQSLYNQPPFELTMHSIDRSSQQQQWNVVSAIAHANVAHLAYPNVKEAASTDFHLYMAAQADEHVYDALPSTMNNDDYHTPAEMFPGTSENEGSEDTDGEDTGDYTSMKSHEADCEYITPIAAAMSESSISGDKLEPMDFETTPTTISDSNTYADTDLSPPGHDDIHSPSVTSTDETSN